MIESNKNEIIIEKDENEEIFTNFIKFLYSGKLTYTSEEDLIKFLKS